MPGPHLPPKTLRWHRAVSVWIRSRPHAAIDKNCQWCCATVSPDLGGGDGLLFVSLLSRWMARNIYRRCFPAWLLNTLLPVLTSQISVLLGLAHFVFLCSSRHTWRVGDVVILLPMPQLLLVQLVTSSSIVTRTGQHSDVTKETKFKSASGAVLASV
jgi:hypothetical protein